MVMAQDFASGPDKLRVEKYLNEGLAAAHALSDPRDNHAGLCVRAAELMRAHAELANRDKGYRKERTYGELTKQLRELAEAAQAAAARAEGELLGATIGGAARLDAAAELAAALAAEAAEAKRECDGAAHAKEHCVALLEAGLKRGLTPQVKREMGAQHREAQQAQQEVVAGLKAELAEAQAASDTRNLKGDRKWSDTGGRMTHSQTRPVLQALKRADQLTEQLASANAKLAELTARANVIPTQEELESYLKHVHCAKAHEKALAAARSKLGVAEKASKLAANELAAESASSTEADALAARARVALAAAEAEGESLRLPDMRAQVAKAVEVTVRNDMEEEQEAARLALADAAEQLRAKLRAAFGAVGALTALDSPGAPSLCLPEASKLELAASQLIGPDGAPTRPMDHAFLERARLEARGLSSLLQLWRKRYNEVVAAAASIVKAEKASAKEKAAAERSAKRLTRAAADAAAREARAVGPVPRALPAEPTDDEEGDEPPVPARVATQAPTSPALSATPTSLSSVPPSAAPGEAHAPVARASPPAGLSLDMPMPSRPSRPPAPPALPAAATAPGRAANGLGAGPARGGFGGGAASGGLGGVLGALPADGLAGGLGALHAWDAPHQQSAQSRSAQTASSSFWGSEPSAAAVDPVAVSPPVAAATAVPAPAPAEPSPWQAVPHAETGKTYWWNPLTGETSWANPTRAVWNPVRDPAGGKTYWWNIDTGETSWETPAEVLAQAGGATAGSAAPTPAAAHEPAAPAPAPIAKQTPAAARPAPVAKPVARPAASQAAMAAAPSPAKRKQAQAPPAALPRPAPAPAPAPLPAPLPAAGVWTCGVCTFENTKPHALVCEVCESRREG